MQPRADTTPPACPNCGEDFAAWHPTRRPRFCPACGQETNLRPPRLGEFLQQFGGAYLATEGALWRTLALLLCRPGELTRRYLAGRRKHYVLPLRLYLTISVIVLLVLRAVAGVGLDAAPPLVLDPKDTEFSLIALGADRGVGLKNGRFYCTDLPAWLCTRLRQRLDHDPKALQHEARQFGERFLSNLGAAMFVVLPAFALWHKLIYWNRRLRYTEHLVFALHLHAFWFAALLATLSPLGWLDTAATLAMPVYALWATKRVYGGRWVPLLLRAGLVCLLYATTLGLALAAVGVWSLVF